MNRPSEITPYAINTYIAPFLPYRKSPQKVNLRSARGNIFVTRSNIFVTRSNIFVTRGNIFVSSQDIYKKPYIVKIIPFCLFTNILNYDIIIDTKATVARKTRRARRRK